MHDTDTGTIYFSIITVCRNAEHSIGSTIDSLVTQTFRNYEYLIIDGASADATLEVVRKHVVYLSPRIFSEPDQGIYDAMNKGVELAKGKWIFFLNAGDSFTDDMILQKVYDHLCSSEECELAYGDVIYQGTEGQRLVRFDWLTKWNLRFEHLCHQAVFAKRELFERLGGFNTQFRITADYDWLLRVFHSGSFTCYLGLPIAFYDADGVSARQCEAAQLERKVVRAKYLPPLISDSMILGYRICSKLLRTAGLWSR